MKTDTEWFGVSKTGLAKIIERRGKVALVQELVSNACDAAGVTRVDVTLAPVDGVPKAWVTVTDDSPNGFKDLAHSWTLFAESERKGDSTKRGRFNLGEKLVLALCDEASIVTVNDGVRFDAKGRQPIKARRERGSEFSGLARITRAELTEVREGLQKIIPPAGITITVDGQAVPRREPIAILEASLPTEIADEDGNLKRTTRKCAVAVYEPLADEVPSLYELGIPVVETGDKWHVDIQQKVPLNMDRDNVTPGYLREIRTLVVNALHDRLTTADAASTFVNEALADKDATPEAVKRALDLKYGLKRAITDPSDPEANMNLVAQGYTLIHGSQLSKDQWQNVRKHEAARPSGQIAPTKKAEFSPDGKDCWVPEEKWTPGMRAVVDYARRIGSMLLGQPIVVSVLSDITVYWAACFGNGSLTFNLGKLGHRWFSNPDIDRINRLLIHEFGHHVAPNHLSEEYHEALCDLGAKLARLALDRPEQFLLLTERGTQYHGAEASA